MRPWEFVQWLCLADSDTMHVHGWLLVHLIVVWRMRWGERHLRTMRRWEFVQWWRLADSDAMHVHGWLLVYLADVQRVRWV